MKRSSNQLTFSKYSGCGNDFILIDDRENLFAHHPTLIQKLCCEKEGIGADGVVLLRQSSVAHFRMTIYNSDGSEAEMCGNGIRCLGKFLVDLGYPRTSYTIQTYDRLLSIHYPDEHLVRVEMGIPTDFKWNIHLDDKVVHYINTGVPHLVYFVKDVEAIAVVEMGRPLRHHPFFNPQGTNVNFVEIVEKNRIKVRTYERGVEGETLACGTGATASAIVAAMIHEINTPVEVLLKSGDHLTIDFTVSGSAVSDVHMCGPAKFLERGTLPHHV